MTGKVLQVRTLDHEAQMIKTSPENKYLKAYFASFSQSTEGLIPDLCPELSGDDKRPSATDGNVSRRYGWEDGHHHIVEWDGDHVLHEGHVHAAEVEREGELESPDDIAKHGPCDGLHEERIGHMRERKGELAHLGVVPLVAREIAHEVRQKTEQEHQDDERHREILHRDSRMVADEEPCGRNAEDEFNHEQSHGADKTKTDSCGEVALVLEEHRTSGIIACVVRRDEGADVPVIDLALSAPDGHGFGFAQ